LSIPKHPKGLGPAGKALWTSVLTRYWMDGEPHKLAILEDICKTADRIAELEAGMKDQPLTVLGAARQLTIHPLIAEIRAQQSHWSQLLKSLQLPEADEADEVSEAQKRKRACSPRSQRPMEAPPMTHIGGRIATAAIPRP
jgi:hypothetical protein